MLKKTPKPVPAFKPQKPLSLDQKIQKHLNELKELEKENRKKKY